MAYLSVCSGIEAATVAWHPLGWRPHAFAEIEAFPSAVLAHHYPDVPNLGDMTQFKDWPDAALNVLVGGTPCQSFSVAGLRKGMADPRGNLALTYLAIAGRYRPEWVAWENVPGVLSSSGGRDFGAFLGGLGELGYGFAYRVLDAQYVRVDGFGRAVPQRRRRVFVIGNSRDWRRAAAVLFEPESLSGNPPPRREARQGVASTISSRPTGGGGLGTDFDLDGGLIAADLRNGTLDDITQTIQAAGLGTERGGNPNAIPHVLIPDISHCLNAGGMGRQDYETETVIAHALRADGFDASEDGTGRWTPIVPVVADTTTAHWERSKGAKAGNQVGLTNPIIAPITLAIRGRGDSHQLEYREDGTANAVLTPNGGRAGIGVGAIAHGWAVRRLTPRECERLQGFPDGYTDVPYRGKQAADGPRYKALGNSMACNVMRWVGRRIQLVDQLAQEIDRAKVA